ncbi:uncharacterized protein LOC117182703 [Belonocnema kinseyi]|uniref:uncharacterized protein LOC117182703 n=1 Tax=Belonocnema kinseyi TaxID=2817044 RepID=UPI00143D0D83|nr:uncharacterized protein LOC117182703 [Belonocnema kinseyi]
MLIATPNHFSTSGSPGLEFFGSLRITTDQGRQFESPLFKKLNTLLRTQHFYTTAYHPAANCLVERFHRQFKAEIKCHADERWTETLPIVLLEIRAAWCDDLKSASAELFFGESLRLPGEFFAFRTGTDFQVTTQFVEDIRRHFQNLKLAPGNRHGKRQAFVFENPLKSPAVPKKHSKWS